MILTIARKEWTERLRDGQFRIAATSTALLLLLAMAAGISQWRQTQSEREQAQQRDREQWLSQGSRNPHSAAHFGVYAFKPRLPLSFIDTGMEPFTGSVIWVEAHYQNPARFRPAEDSTALQRFGEFTPALVLQWFLPLLLLLLGFSAFTAEREQGTLRLLLSLGVLRWKLAAGKAIGLAAVLGCVLIPAALAAALTMRLLSGQAIGSGDLYRLVPLAAAYLAYLSLFVFLGLAVSASVASPRTSLAILLGFWAFATFVAPRAVADAAEAAHPSPAAADFWREIAGEMRGADGHSENDKRILQLKQRTLAQYGVSRAEDLPVNFEGLRLQAGEEHGNHVFDEYYGKLWAAYEAQEQWHQWAGTLSPLLAVRSISMAMAGTDLAHFRHFAEATEEYRRKLNKTMNMNVAHHSRPGQYYYFADRQLWESIPAYEYRPPGAGWALERQALPAAILLGWLGASMLALILAVGRMRPV